MLVHLMKLTYFFSNKLQIFQNINSLILNYLYFEVLGVFLLEKKLILKKFAIKVIIC